MLSIVRAEPRIGAIATGVDVNALADVEWGRLYQAWLDCNVLVIRGQRLTMEELLRFSRRFGRPKMHFAAKTRHAIYPELTEMGVRKTVASAEANRAIYNRGEGWHTDSPYDTEICKATALYALEIPSVGGDTAFSSQYASYEALPDALKQRIEGLKAKFYYGGGAPWRLPLLDEKDRDPPPSAIHSIVRAHPETGRKALYINPIDPGPRLNPEYLDQIIGMTKPESDALLEELYSYLLQPGAQYRHKWSVGDLVIWDNRSSLHNALGGYPPEENRIHWRTTIMEPDGATAAQESRAA